MKQHLRMIPSLSELEFGSHDPILHSSQQPVTPVPENPVPYYGR